MPGIVELGDKRRVAFEQKIIGDDECADRRADIAVASGNRSIHRRFKVIAGNEHFHVGPLIFVLDLFSHPNRAVQPLGAGTMSNVTYYVAMGFERVDAELVALDPVECQSSTQAISRARSLAATKAGAVAFSRTGDPNLGEFSDAVVLFIVGDVPDEIPGG